MTCDNCDGDVVEIPDEGYVCADCQLVAIQGSITGWQVLSQQLL